MRLVGEVAGQEHAELAGREVGTVTAHEGNDGIAENADQLVG
jgi:hypothetical protein